MNADTDQGCAMTSPIRPNTISATQRERYHTPFDECNMKMTEKRIGRATLINGDCMDYLATLADNAFDLAIVDPPYGVGSVTYMPCKRENAPGEHLDHYEVISLTRGHCARFVPTLRNRCSIL